MRSHPKRSPAFNIWTVALSLCLPGSTLGGGARDSIRLALNEPIRTFDPRQSVDANSQSLEDLIHCSLMTIDSDGRPTPGIATASPRWKTPKLLEVTLKDGVLFSDGKIVTPEDVLATYQTLMADKSYARSDWFHQVERVEKQGQSIIFSLKEPDATFIGKLIVGILPAAVTNSSDIDPIKSPTCGPYHIKSIDADHMTLGQNPYYNGSPKPRLKRIEISTVKNESARFAKLKAGEIDLVQNNINRAALKDIEKKNLQLKILRRPGLTTTYIGFNMRDKTVESLAVREAIALTVNRQEIINMLLSGFATLANTLLPPDSHYYNSSLTPRPLDLRKAEKLLEEAGFKKQDHHRLELSYKTTTDVNNIAIARGLASQLKKIGVKLVVEPKEWRFLKQDLDAGRIQLWGLTWTGFKDPDVYRHAFATSSFPPNGANRGRYTNPHLDELLEKGKITSSQEARIRIYQDAQELIDKDLPYIFLWHEDNFAVVNRALKGFRVYADGRYSALTQAFFVN